MSKNKIINKRFSKAFKLAFTSGLLFLMFAFVSPGEKYFEIAKNIDIFSTLFKEVNAYYVDEVEPKKLINTGIAAMLESLDPYTDYIPEESMEAFSIQTTGQYAGIGALIGIINNKTIVTEPYEGFPAFKGGIRVGDELISIDGKNVESKPTAETSAMLKGKPNTPVVVVVKRLGQSSPITFKLIREKIKINNVSFASIIEHTIGFIKLDDFTPGAGKEVEQAVIKLKAQGATSFILDLRNNPGGLLHEAVNTANVFIPKEKEIVSTKGKLQEWNKFYTTLNQPIDTQIPLVVLINGNSASASEIVAGSLQDYDRAILIGQKTFGKGLVQTTRQLPYNAQIKITTAKYYIPSGRCIQALDYAHRAKDGSVSKFADSVRAEYKTKGGRKVFDGSGLDPDIAVSPSDQSPLVSSLISSALIFEYASVFCGEHPTIPTSFINFKMNDVDYNKFVFWMKDKKISYPTELEKQLTSLIESSKKEQITVNFQNRLLALKLKVEQNKANDFQRFKDEIIEVLEQQIAFHYKLNKGLVEASLNHDNEIAAAKKILIDSTSYRKILLSQ
jgi:carboxyl-terminal processing protease